MKDHLTDKHSGNYKSEITLADIKALRVKETKRIKALQAKERGVRPEVQVLQDSSANTQKSLGGKVVSDFKSLKFISPAFQFSVRRRTMILHFWRPPKK